MNSALSIDTLLSNTVLDKIYNWLTIFGLNLKVIWNYLRRICCCHNDAHKWKTLHRIHFSHCWWQWLSCIHQPSFNLAWKYFLLSCNQNIYSKDFMSLGFPPSYSNFPLFHGKVHGMDGLCGIHTNGPHI